MGFIIVEVCGSNSINTEALEQFESRYPDVAVLRMECLASCGLCRLQPYALVNGVRITGRTTEECIQKIEAAIEREMSEETLFS